MLMLKGELRFFARQPSLYISFGLFLAIALFMSSFQKVVNGYGSNIHINGTFFVTEIVSILTLPALFLIVNFVGSAAMRDHTSKMSELIFCKPIDPAQYQLGRFFGAFLIVCLVFFAVPLGLYISSIAPWISMERVGELNFLNHWYAYIYLAVPTLFIFSCLLFSVASKVRSTMSMYLTVVAIIVISGAGDTFFNSNRLLAAYLDPFGSLTFSEISRYWTVFEKNTLKLSFDGLMLYNRLIWISIGIIALLLFSGITRPLMLNASRAKNSIKDKRISSEATVLQTYRIDFKSNPDAFVHQLVTKTIFEIKQVLFARAFVILCTSIFLLMIAVLFQPKGMFNTSDLPYTQIMVQVIKGSMVILSAIIITYYSAEVFWRERSDNVNEIIDSLPVSNAVFWFSKLVAIWVVLASILVLSMGFTIGFQLLNDFHIIDIGQYVTSLFYFLLLPWMMLVVLAFFFQVMSKNKYLGMFTFVLFLLVDFALEPIGIGHNMLRFSKSPEFIYSDLNGYADVLSAHTWYMIYWGGLAVILCVVGFGLWSRGNRPDLKERWKNLPGNVNVTGKRAIAFSAVTMVIAGAYIVYNTLYLNDFSSEKVKDLAKVEYENNFSQLRGAPIPVIEKLKVEMDFFPDKRQVVTKAEFVVRNKTNQPISKFLVSLPYYQPKAFEFAIDGGELDTEIHALNTRWFVFSKPVQPNQFRKGNFKIDRQYRGFKDKKSNISDVEIVHNGTFFESGAMFPIHGYQADLQIKSAAKRKQYGLSVDTGKAALEDKTRYGINEKGVDIGYIDFTATLSTTADQIAIAPGKLLNSWQQGNRRFFRYQSEHPIQYFLGFMSGRYTLHKQMHNNTSIEIFHHPEHHFNLESMSVAIADSLDYFTASFSPYPHSQVRIVEFPNYRNYAQSFPNTIAYSERLGFIMDVRKPQAIDQAYYVTAHEMAHQWWGNQVDGASVQGSTMIVETLAQHGALSLFKKKFGKFALAKVLRLELDNYLQGRANETVKEAPLVRVEAQPYIYYNKGAIAMMSLVDAFGEKRVNASLRQFLNEFQYREDRYPTTLDLLAHLSLDATDSEMMLIQRLFTEINIYDVKAKAMAVTETPKGLFNVELTIDANRFVDAGNGQTELVAFDDPLQVLFSEVSPELLSDTTKHTAVHSFNPKSGENTFTITLPFQPKFASIDPFVTLTDRDILDNVISI